MRLSSRYLCWFTNSDRSAAPTSGAETIHDRSTLTRNLQPLLAQGWIVEGTPGADGRSRPLTVTEQGKAVLRDAAPAWSTAQASARTLIGQAGADTIMTIARDLPRPPR